ncbi:MAG TPA: hypothetical protein VNS88_18065 [Nitrospiraceae bacterium]|nr:hypothetical protein [Nitrospiraceae bacterium]
MGLAVNDVLAVSIRGSLFSQRIITVLHYAVNVAATGTVEDNLLQIATDWTGGTGSRAGILSHMLDCQGVEYNCDEVRVQRVYPTRSIYMTHKANDPGAHADPCTTSNIAASLVKRTSTPGRKGVGRVQLAGIPQTAYADGLIDPVYAGLKLTPWCNDLISSYSTSGPVLTLVPVLYNPTAAPPRYSLIIQIFPEDTVRTMHRRTLRVGE